jgi:hypothetical protein
MNRREALKTTGFVIGYSLSASAIAAALYGCAPEAGTPVGTDAIDWTPEFFDEDQIGLIADIAETILPETETHGAKSAGVHRYIDDEVQYMFTPQEQYNFVLGLEDVEARALAISGIGFRDCNEIQRIELLKKLEAEAQIAEDSGESYGRPFIKTMKSLTFSGYFTSKLIGESVLNYDPIPGQYQGCIEIDESARIWSI